MVTCKVKLAGSDTLMSKLSKGEQINNIQLTLQSCEILCYAYSSHERWNYTTIETHYKR